MTNSSDQNPDNGVFAWQFPNADREKAWRHYSYGEERWWGDFGRELPVPADPFEAKPWSMGPFEKYSGNPVFAPDPGSWDCGRYDGGVHNGATVVHQNRFWYVYRGERPIDIPQKGPVDYICDIGIAVSDDGVNFERVRDYSPLFRTGTNRQYSYEDVNLVEHKGVFYLFCNQWFWENMADTSINGTFLATSTDLLHWQRHGIVFPNAAQIHRNAVVLQNPQNEAVKVNGRFWMYINDGIIATSEDMIHWISEAGAHHWPGGEGCFAMADHNPERPDDIVLFTGGNHTGHFYAIGEVLLSKTDPTMPLDWLGAPALHAETTIPHENGRNAEPPHEPISSFADCIFFNGLTRYNGKWWLYYGGSEFYTCLATANAR